MSYSVKFVVIISIVAAVSFFTASVVIPEKNAVAPTRKKSPPRALTSPIMPRGGGDIPVVVADGRPAEKPILVSGTAAAPIDHKALAPVAAAALADANAQTVVATADTRPPAAPAAPVDTRVPPPAAPIETKAPPAAAAPADAKPATFSAAVDTAAPDYVPFVGRTTELFDVKSVPPNTMAARLRAELAAPAPKAAPPAAPTAMPAVAAATPPPPAAARPDTVRRRDPNAPLGYRLASAAVCAAVENRAPKDVGDRFSKESGGVYYYTHIVGAVDSASVLHRWYRDGKLIQTSILPIRSASWRTHSKRSFASMDDPSGNWRVEIIDQKSGKVLESAAFVVE